MEPRRHRLRMYGELSDHEPLDWQWVDGRLDAAGTYWVVPCAPAPPHPRPVWGVWLDTVLHLSIGSPVIAAAVGADPVVTVHLDSGTDVVILEGRAALDEVTAAEVIAAYNSKYSWDYRVEEYGPLTRIDPTTVLAWRAAGWAGRDSFRATGRWGFDPPDGR